MVTMENAEEVMQILERFTRLKQKEIPKELDDYLSYVAKTGDTVFKWPSLKYLFREKLLNVIKHFHDTSPRIDEIPPYPNVDPFNYESMKSALLERLELFNAAPFTIQRLCELLIDPRKQYSRIDKFMRALEKNILVVSTVEPGRKRAVSENGDSLDSMVNGDLSLDVNVDIDMEADSLFSLDAAQHVSNENANNSIAGALSDKHGDLQVANIASGAGDAGSNENSENNGGVRVESPKAHVHDEENRLSPEERAVLHTNACSNATTVEETVSNEDDTAVPHPKKVKLDLSLTEEPRSATTNDQPTNNELPKSSTDTSMDGASKKVVIVKEEATEADSDMPTSMKATPTTTETTSTETSAAAPQTTTEKENSIENNSRIQAAATSSEEAIVSAAEREQGKELIPQGTKTTDDSIRNNENDDKDKSEEEETRTQGSEEQVSTAGTSMKKDGAEERHMMQLKTDENVEDELKAKNKLILDQANEQSKVLEESTAVLLEKGMTKQLDAFSETVDGGGQGTGEKKDADGILKENQEATTIEIKKDNVDVVGAEQNVNQTLFLDDGKTVNKESKEETATAIEKSNDDIGSKTKAKTEINSEQVGGDKLSGGLASDSEKQKTDEEQQQLLLLQKIDETISKSELKEFNASQTLNSIEEDKPEKATELTKNDAAMCPQVDVKVVQSEHIGQVLPVTPTKVEVTPTPTSTPTSSTTLLLNQPSFEEIKNVVVVPVQAEISAISSSMIPVGVIGDQMLEMVAEEAEDVPIDEEEDASPPLDEVVMAEPPITTILNGATGVIEGVAQVAGLSNLSPTAMATEDESLGSAMLSNKMNEEEPAGMEVDDTSQEAMDQ